MCEGWHVCLPSFGFTSWLIWTGCRLVTVSWVPGSAFAIWEVACTTDRWRINTDKTLYTSLPPATFMTGHYACTLHPSPFGNLCVRVCVCAFTCWAVCTCWTTCVGTPVWTTTGGGLESETLSLEWRDPSGKVRGNGWFQFCILTTGHSSPGLDHIATPGRSFNMNLSETHFPKASS